MKDGGPAFPVKGGMCFFVPESAEDATKQAVKQQVEVATNGMSLRDWFAGQALGFAGAGAIAAAGRGALTDPDEMLDHAVKQAWKYADAMLAEREKEGA